MKRDKKTLLIILYAAAPIAFSIWMVLLNNFVVEKTSFSGKDIGILQSIREVPGFLAFTVVFVLYFLKQQSFSIFSLIMMGFGTAIVGFFPSHIGLYTTTLIMSVGFHYLETLQQSLSLQWLSKKEAPEFFGKLLSIKSIISLVAYGGVYIALSYLDASYTSVYLLGGGITMYIGFFAWFYFPTFTESVKQRNTLVLRKRYWLFYLLTFLSGARRQIFVVFAGFLLVEKFQYGTTYIAMLFLINCALNMWFAPAIGKFIAKFGERKALMVEYIGLIIIFTSYAFVESGVFASILYVLDHLFFALAIALKTYFQKIADPKDISSTTGVSFSINHIAAIILPALLGFIWVISPTAVFLTGTGFALLSFIFSRFIPEHPEVGKETLFFKSV